MKGKSGPFLKKNLKINLNGNDKIKEQLYFLLLVPVR
jgi:hypothetical protein